MYLLWVTLACILPSSADVVTSRNPLGGDAERSARKADCKDDVRKPLGTVLEKATYRAVKSGQESDLIQMLALLRDAATRQVRKGDMAGSHLEAYLEAFIDSGCAAQAETAQTIRPKEYADAAIALVRQVIANYGQSESQQPNRRPPSEVFLSLKGVEKKRLGMAEEIAKIDTWRAAYEPIVAADPCQIGSRVDIPLQAIDQWQMLCVLQASSLAAPRADSDQSMMGYGKYTPVSSEPTLGSPSVPAPASDMFDAEPYLAEEPTWPSLKEKVHFVPLGADSSPESWQRTGPRSSGWKADPVEGHRNTVVSSSASPRPTVVSAAASPQDAQPFSAAHLRDDHSPSGMSEDLDYPVLKTKPVNARPAFGPSTGRKSKTSRGDLLVERHTAGSEGGNTLTEFDRGDFADVPGVRPGASVIVMRPFDGSFKTVSVSPSFNLGLLNDEDEVIRQGLQVALAGDAPHLETAPLSVQPHFPHPDAPIPEVRTSPQNASGTSKSIEAPNTEKHIPTSSLDAEKADLTAKDGNPVVKGDAGKSDRKGGYVSAAPAAPEVHLSPINRLVIYGLAQPSPNVSALAAMFKDFSLQSHLRLRAFHDGDYSGPLRIEPASEAVGKCLERMSDAAALQVARAPERRRLLWSMTAFSDHSDTEVLPFPLRAIEQIASICEYFVDMTDDSAAVGADVIEAIGHHQQTEALRLRQCYLDTLPITGVRRLQVPQLKKLAQDIVQKAKIDVNETSDESKAIEKCWKKISASLGTGNMKELEHLRHSNAICQERAIFEALVNIEGMRIQSYTKGLEKVLDLYAEAAKAECAPAYQKEDNQKEEVPRRGARETRDSVRVADETRQGTGVKLASPEKSRAGIAAGRAIGSRGEFRYPFEDMANPRAVASSLTLPSETQNAAEKKPSQTDADAEDVDHEGLTEEDYTIEAVTASESLATQKAAAELDALLQGEEATPAMEPEASMMSHEQILPPELPYGEGNVIVQDDLPAPEALSTAEYSSRSDETEMPPELPRDDGDAIIIASKSGDNLPATEALSTAEYRADATLQPEVPDSLAKDARQEPTTDNSDDRALEETVARALARDESNSNPSDNLVSEELEEQEVVKSDEFAYGELEKSVAVESNDDDLPLPEQEIEGISALPPVGDAPQETGNPPPADAARRLLLEAEYGRELVYPAVVYEALGSGGNMRLHGQLAEECERRVIAEAKNRLHHLGLEGRQAEALEFMIDKLLIEKRAETPEEVKAFANLDAKLIEACHTASPPQPAAAVRSLLRTAVLGMHGETFAKFGAVHDVDVRTNRGIESSAADTKTRRSVRRGNS